MSSANKRPAKINKPVVTKSSNNNVNAAKSNFIELKEETLRWIFSILAAILVYWIAAQLIVRFYHPDINSLIELGHKYTFSADVRPKPVESMLFRCGVVIITLCIFAFYSILIKAAWIKSAAETPFFLAVSSLAIILIAALIYIDFSAPNPFGPGSGEQAQNVRDFTAKTNFDFFFDGIFLGGHLMLYTFILVPLIAFLFYYGIKKKQWENSKLFNKIVLIVGYIMIGGAVLAIVLMNTFDFPYTFENKYDFNAIYYSMTQVYAGSPMLVNGLYNTYGLYPQMLNPVFHIIGLSVFKFSFVLSIMEGVMYFFSFYFLNKLVRNKVILFLGFSTVLFFSNLDFRILTSFDCSFAFFPIRYIIPATLVFMSTLYVHKRSQIIYWLTFAIMAFFILWNPEIGMVCYLAWLAFNTYNDFYNATDNINFKRLAFHWLSGIGMVILAFGFYKLCIYAFYGISPDLGSLFGYIAIFTKIGMGLLPMTLVNPWNIEAVVIILGFTYSIVKFCRKEITPRISLVFLTSVIALGFFVYLQGRSHNWPFAVSSMYFLLLLTILGDELWVHIKDNNIFPLHALFVVFLFLVSFSFFEILFNTDKINELVYQNDDKSKAADEEKKIENSTDFILKNSKEKEKIMILTAGQYQGLYFDGYKRVSGHNPGLEELLLYSDLDRLDSVLKDSTFDVFIEPKLCTTPYMIVPLAEMAATYDVKEATNSIALLTKHKAKDHFGVFFGDVSQQILHRKYEDNVSGASMRVNDALGMKPIATGNEFSVEVFFKSSVQIYDFATLIGNMNDTSGFVIAKILNTPNYFFGINGKGTAVPMPDNEWIYCVMNVYPDHMDIYENGKLAGTLALQLPMKQSPEKLFAGNAGFMRYYIGAISEIAVNNRALDNNQIQSTWEEITKSIGGK